MHVGLKVNLVSKKIRNLRRQQLDSDDDSDDLDLDADSNTDDDDSEISVMVPPPDGADLHKWCSCLSSLGLDYSSVSTLMLAGQFEQALATLDSQVSLVKCLQCLCGTFEGPPRMFLS